MTELDQNSTSAPEAANDIVPASSDNGTTSRAELGGPVTEGESHLQQSPDTWPALLYGLLFSKRPSGYGGLIWLVASLTLFLRDSWEGKLDTAEGFYFLGGKLALITLLVLIWKVISRNKP